MLPNILATMPDGLLRGLTAQELNDLFAFLRQVR
jgi:hypothetical protein